MDILNKTHGCFLGVMIGDALGAPVEMMTPEAILEKTNGLGITDFNHQIRRNQFKSEILAAPVDLVNVLEERTRPEITGIKKFWGSALVNFGLAKKPKPNLTITRQTPVVNDHYVANGSTTDDWQLTEIICKSLIRRKHFDILDIALAHVEAYQNSTSGWGGTTRNGIKELQEYFVSLGERGRSPLENPVILPGRGSGNGIAMKIAPVALRHIVDRDFDQLGEECAGLGRLTHSDPRAWAAALAVASVLVESSGMLIQPTAWLKTELLKRVLENLAPFERKYGSGGLKRFSSYLKVLLDEALLFGPIENLRDRVGTDCIAIESVVFAIALFLRNPLDFESGVLEAVNSGGDADTVGSIVGGLIGALVGHEGIPSDWKLHNVEFQKAEVTAKKLISTLFKE